METLTKRRTLLWLGSGTVGSEIFGILLVFLVGYWAYGGFDGGIQLVSLFVVSLLSSILLIIPFACFGFAAIYFIFNLYGVVLALFNMSHSILSIIFFLLPQLVAFSWGIALSVIATLAIIRVLTPSEE